jgi:serine/threonine protein kinase
MASLSTNAKAGTMRWQAPELLNPNPNEGNGASSVASDVYAFACVCYEVKSIVSLLQMLTTCQMFSGEIPMHDLRDFGVVLAVTQGRRPQRPSHDLCQIRGLDDEIWDLIENCWASIPSERPSASQIKAHLYSMPSLPLDQRPADTFEPFLPWRILGSQPRHPFSDLTFSSDDTYPI